MEPWNDKALLQSYHDTRYQVFVPALDIRIGDLHPGLDVFAAEHAADCWAFLSACNPASVQYTEEANSYRMFALSDMLDDADLFFRPGEARALAGDWPPEPSFLILGISREQTRQLARRFGQYAFLTGNRGEAAALVWTDQPAE